MWQNLQMAPPFERFQGENKKLPFSCQKNQHVKTIIFGQLDSFWAGLWSKFFFLSQNRDFENGVIVKISKLLVLGRYHLSLGVAQAPPNWNGINLQIFTITPFSKSRFWGGKIFLVQSAAQKWSSLQVVVSMHWLLWQEMSNFYF